MKDELVKLLESVKQLNENEYIRWEQLDVDSWELYDKLADDGFMDNTDVIERLDNRNNDIDCELDMLDENDDFDSELIESFESEQQYNNDIMDKLDDDTHVMNFDDDDYEYRYVPAFIMVDYLQAVINNDKLHDKYFVDNETVEKLVDIDLNQQYVTLRQARDMVFNDDREGAGDKGRSVISVIVNKLAYGAGLSQDNVIINLGDGYYKALPVSKDTVLDILHEYDD